MKKVLLLTHTVLNLKAIQIYYQLWYRIREVLRKGIGFKYPLSLEVSPAALHLEPWIDKSVSYNNGIFTFLNQSLENPSYSDHTYSPLWRYNLNYMDFLLQPDMDKETGLMLIQQFINELPKNSIGVDPYPIALRGINWIKFCAKHGVESKKIVTSLYAQYHILLDKLEYHLLANHLLEDAFSLLFGAFYFRDVRFYHKANRILEKELKEQVLDDGAHFELSPMYHQILLDRLFDCINLVQHNQIFPNQHTLLNLLQNKAKQMLSWLSIITFANGEIPLLNDAAPGIAPGTQALNRYAARLRLLDKSKEFDTLLPLSASGYRKFSTPIYVCIIDIGQVGPPYQPGHAHADTFNFVLQVKEEALIVDTGISTYNAGAARLRERGTAAHNTVTVAAQNSSEVWSSFRMGRRATVEVLEDKENRVVAQHNGFRKLGTTHQRTWQVSESQIDITDSLTGKITEGVAHFWFDPKHQPIKNGNTVETKNAILDFDNATNIELIETKIPQGYNKFITTHKIEVTFKNNLRTKIVIA